jgi:hypothetical protein
MNHLSRMPVGAAISVGAVVGLALGIVVSVTTTFRSLPRLGRCLVVWSAGSRAETVRSECGGFRREGFRWQTLPSGTTRSLSSTRY